MSLAPGQPQGCTGASLGCSRARDILGSLRPSPEKATCSLSISGEINEFGPCTRQSGSRAYMYAYNLIRWATFRLQKVKKQRERWKNKAAKKGKDEKEDKTLKREKPPHLVWGFFWAIFYYKIWEKLKCWPFFGPLIEVVAICIYTPVKASPCRRLRDLHAESGTVSLDSGRA